MSNARRDFERVGITAERIMRELIRRDHEYRHVAYRAEREALKAKVQQAQKGR